MTKSTPPSSAKPFLETLPGIITAIATLITAIGGLTAIVLQGPIGAKLFPPSPTPATAPSGTVQSATPSPASVSSLPPTSTVIGSAAAFDFQTCPTLCNGTNASDSFSAGVKKIYAQFNYDHFSPGIKYVRTWSLNGMEWIRYSCNWDGPTSGTEVLTLTEPEGLHSGIWVMTILLNDTVILRGEVSVLGNWTYWAPAGTINACHGTVK